MQIKKTLFLIFSLAYQTILAQTVSKPPYLDVMLSHTKSIGAYKQSNPMLIDSSQAYIYFDLLTTSPFNAPNDTVWIELKKKNQQSEKMKPIWSKQCIIQDGAMATLDSIEVATNMPESGNYLLDFYFIIQGEKVFTKKWGLQVLRPKSNP